MGESLPLATAHAGRSVGPAISIDSGTADMGEPPSRGSAQGAAQTLCSAPSSRGNLLQSWAGRRGNKGPVGGQTRIPGPTHTGAIRRLEGTAPVRTRTCRLRRGGLCLLLCVVQVRVLLLTEQS